MRARQMCQLPAIPALGKQKQETPGVHWQAWLDVAGFREKAYEQSRKTSDINLVHTHAPTRVYLHMCTHAYTCMHTTHTKRKSKTKKKWPLGKLGLEKNIVKLKKKNPPPPQLPSLHLMKDRTQSLRLGRSTFSTCINTRKILAMRPDSKRFADSMITQKGIYGLFMCLCIFVSVFSFFICFFRHSAGWSRKIARSKPVWTDCTMWSHLRGLGGGKERREEGEKGGGSK